MNLEKKKQLAARTLGIGKGRVIFNKERLDEIKEVITKQDIKDLLKNNAISVKEISGRKKKIKRKTRKREGSVKKNVKTRKREYMVITRKLRSFLSELRKKGIINQEEHKQLRKEIRARAFKSKAHLKERLTKIVSERERK